MLKGNIKGEGWVNDANYQFLEVEGSLGHFLGAELNSGRIAVLEIKDLPQSGAAEPHVVITVDTKMHRTKPCAPAYPALSA